MSITAGDILTNVRLTLNDPTGQYWDTASNPTELLGYLQQYCRMATGYKPDLNSTRAVINLAPGINQQIPDDGMQFLDADIAGNGQAVFVRTFEELKQSKFSNLGSAAADDNPQAVAADPRLDNLFYCWPPSTGNSASTLQIRYSLKPTVMVDDSSPYPLKEESADSAYWYVLALAFRKTSDRQDLDRAAVCFQNSMAFFPSRSQGQFGEAPKPD